MCCRMWRYSTGGTDRPETCCTWPALQHNYTLNDGSCSRNRRHHTRPLARDTDDREWAVERRRTISTRATTSTLETWLQGLLSSCTIICTSSTHVWHRCLAKKHPFPHTQPTPTTSSFPTHMPCRKPSFYTPLLFSHSSNQPLQWPYSGPTSRGTFYNFILWAVFAWKRLTDRRTDLSRITLWFYITR